MRTLMELVRNGRLDLQQLITHRFGLEDIGEAHRSPPQKEEGSRWPPPPPPARAPRGRGRGGRRGGNGPRLAGGPRPLGAGDGEAPADPHLAEGQGPAPTT